VTADLSYHRTAERPELRLWLIDDDGTLIDLSSGYTFTFKIGQIGQTGELSKTSGITGAAGAGSEPTGTPNVVVAWSAGELDITPGTYSWELTATTGNLDRVFNGTFVVKDVIL
jgi:hypothetical protein